MESQTETSEGLGGFGAKLRGIESIIKQAMQQHSNLTLNFNFYDGASIGQHIERTDTSNVWMGGGEKKKVENMGEKPTPTVTAEQAVKALKKCQSYIWGNAAYSVPFCVLRDAYGWEDNASQFERMLSERGIDIGEGTINTAFSRNSWLKYEIDKWEENGVKKRALILRDEFKKEVDIVVKADKEQEALEQNR